MVLNMKQLFRSLLGSTGIQLRHPQPDDGAAVNELVSGCPPLDTNSVYCNLLQCTHFAETSVLAETTDGSCVGFTSGYFVPAEPDALFVWQVAVSKVARRTGLGSRMLAFLIDGSTTRPNRILTSINPGNLASRAMFTALADQYGATIQEANWFASKTHFNGQHPDEILLEIGPLQRAQHTSALIPIHLPGWPYTGFRA